MTQPALLIPLNTQLYEAFEPGEKTSVLRLYSPRWNEKTCPPGRRVILSEGYVKRHLLEGVIREFHKRDVRTFGSTYQASIQNIYGTRDKPIAETRSRLDQTASVKGGAARPRSRCGRK